MSRADKGETVTHLAAIIFEVEQVLGNRHFPDERAPANAHRIVPRSLRAGTSSPAPHPDHCSSVDWRLGVSRSREDTTMSRHPPVQMALEVDGTWAFEQVCPFFQGAWHDSSPTPRVPSVIQKMY